MSTTRSDTPTDALGDRIAAARRAVDRERSVLAEWETKRSAAEFELTSMQARAGSELLDNPAAEDELAAAIAQLQARAGLAEKAIVAQRPRVTAAESAYLAAEADALEPAVEAARATLAEHEAKTEKLLKQLADHEGEFISMHECLRYIHSVPGVLVEIQGPVVRPKSLALREELVLRQRQLAVARELAAGNDPERLVRSWSAGQEVYPAHALGPDAVVKPPQFLRSVEHARELVRDLLAAQTTLEAEIEEWSNGPLARDEAAPVALARRRARLEELPSEIAEARAQLAALTGSSD